MAQIVLILGESGTGKTTSLRNFQTGEMVKKPCRSVVNLQC